MKIAAQMYTVRKFCETQEDIFKSLKKIKEIGYSAVQLSALGPIDTKILKAYIEDFELEVCATHNSFQRFEENLGDIIYEHKLLGCKYAGLGGMPGELRKKGIEGYQQFVERAVVVANKLWEEGIHFIYHNHSFEFERFGDLNGWQYIIKNLPDSAQSEIDTCWVQVGGGDPAEYIRSMSGRTDIVHFKDYFMDLNDERCLAEVGYGNLNWASIFEACESAGVKYAAVEQDTCSGDPFESLRLSYEFLKKHGYK